MLFEWSSIINRSLIIGYLVQGIEYASHKVYTTRGRNFEFSQIKNDKPLSIVAKTGVTNVNAILAVSRGTKRLR